MSGYDENRKNVYFMFFDEASREAFNKEIIPIDILTRVVTFGYALGYPDAYLWKDMSEIARRNIIEIMGLHILKETDSEVWVGDRVF